MLIAATVDARQVPASSAFIAKSTASTRAYQKTLESAGAGREQQSEAREKAGPIHMYAWNAWCSHLADALAARLQVNGQLIPKTAEKLADALVDSEEQKELGARMRHLEKEPLDNQGFFR